MQKPNSVIASVAKQSVHGESIQDESVTPNFRVSGLLQGFSLKVQHEGFALRNDNLRIASNI